ncbi:phage baseplate protein [Laribacter hongkongensis]|uniref:phage baseplate protein n=1 Tax=Laribacter hongkongensis TaxID=168471 RepID=UPI0004060FED|nr:hypothetical protein [Laribacter hongkongensis]
MARVINRRIGTVELDAVVSEGHQSDLRVTENPIESGAQIADHAVLEPKSVTITGVMVDHDHQMPQQTGNMLPSIRGLDFMDKIQPLVTLPFRTPQTLSRMQRELNSFSATAQTAVSKAMATTRALAPWLPDFAALGTLDSSSGATTDRVRQVYDALTDIQKSGETIEIETGLRLYENMLVTSVSVSQTKDGSAEFNISAREVLIVETESTSGVDVPSSGEKKSGRSAAQSAKKAQKGKVSTKDLSGNRSLIKALDSWAKER